MPTYWDGTDGEPQMNSTVPNFKRLQTYIGDFGGRDIIVWETIGPVASDVLVVDDEGNARVVAKMKCSCPCYVSWKSKL